MKQQIQDLNPGHLDPGVALKYLWDQIKLHVHQGKPRHRQGEAVFSNPEAESKQDYMSVQSRSRLHVPERPRLSFSLLAGFLEPISCPHQPLLWAAFHSLGSSTLPL